MSSVVASSALNSPLLRLQRILTPAEHQDFQFASLDDLHRAIEVIQQQQVKNQKLQCFVKIKPFLETMEQYGKVIGVFLNATNLLAFVWGPMKFILQTASTVADVLEEILDTYQGLGECLPQFQQYEALFRNNSRLQRVLEYIYEDILDFHRKALKVFRHRAWCLLFQCTWKGLASSIRSVRANLQRHRALVEAQATLAHFEEAQEARERARDAVLRAEEAEKRRMMITVTEWLRPPDSKSDQERYAKIRDEYPSTGRWLLKARKVKKWLDNMNTEVPLLWLYGIPGAGKSVLASLIVEEVEKLKTSSSTGRDQLSVVFFYCKYGNQNKNNCLAVMRGLISQLLKQSPETLPLLYNDITMSGEIALTSQQDAERFLKKALDSTSAITTYIIIDGLDECVTGEMITIVTAMTAIAESLNMTTPATCRLFFTSRNERAISRALSKATGLQIRPQDNAGDMKKYTEVWSTRIQAKFALTDLKRQELQSSILSGADGMFLFCVLVLQNLLGLSTREELDLELEPDTFPKGLEDAYVRIVERIKRDSTSSQLQAAFKVLGLLACCRRPLKKREIQGFFSISIDGTVDYENRCLRDDIKDLCGSLVEICGDAVEFVHRTVKQYLVEGKLLALSVAEMDLAITCVRYLSTAGYDRLIGEAQIQHFTSLGHYAFLEYASVHWINHVRSHVAAMTTTDQTEVIIPLLQNFLDMHWDNTQLLARESAKAENRTPLQRDFSILEQCSPEIFRKLVVLSAVSPLAETPHNEAVPSLSGPLACTNLGVVIHRVRTVVENMYAATTGSAKGKLETYYGSHCFKCTQEDCAYFSEGFSDRQARDKHQNWHTRFLCTEAGCYKGIVGCGSEEALKVHMEKDHTLGARSSPQTSNRRLKFPAVRNKDRASTNGPLSSQPSERITPVVVGTSTGGHAPEHGNVDSALKKMGFDWSAEFNPNVVRVLDIDLVHTLAHNSIICATSFSLDGSMLATSFNYSAQLFNTFSGKVVATFRHAAEEVVGDLYVRCLYFSPTGSYLVTGGEDGVIVVWDILATSRVFAFQAHENHIYGIVYSPDGQWIASVGQDRTALVWRPGDITAYLDTVRPVDTLPNLPPGVVFRSCQALDGLTSVAFSPDSKFIAVGSLDHSVSIWDINTGSQIKILKGGDVHTDSIYSVAFGPNFELYSASLDRTIKKWSRFDQSGHMRCLQTMIAHKDSVLGVTPIPHIAGSRAWICSGSKDRTFIIWDANNGEAHIRVNGHTNSVLRLAACIVYQGVPKTLLATASGDMNVRIWR